MAISRADEAQRRSEAASFVLRDGREVIIRQLTPEDGTLVADAVARADPFDLHRRFMGAPPPTHVLLKLLASADGSHDAALGAFDRDGRLIAVAQFDRVDGDTEADVAVEVGKAWQHAGLGTELLRCIARLASAHGIERFRVAYFADNLAVASLLRAVGATRTGPVEAGTAEAEVDLLDHQPDGLAQRATAEPVRRKDPSHRARPFEDRPQQSDFAVAKT